MFRRAVLAFQLAVGITADGVLGPQTRGALAEALAELPPDAREGIDYPGIGEVSAPGPVVKLSADLSDAFLSELVAMAARFRARGAKATATDFARVWFVESAGLHAHMPNGAGEPFGGMNQMGPTERKAAGFLGTFHDWLALGELAQLPYVERFYQPHARWLTNARAIYVATFAPAYVSHASDPGFVLYSYRGLPGMPAVTAPDAEWAKYNATHSDPYGENRVFDRERKGAITIGDLARPIEAAEGFPRWHEIKGRLAALGGGGAGPDFPSVRGVLGVALVVAAALLSRWAA